ncbi:hypothetical protein [Amycolatopsis sp. DG1A-15b]|uniref:hypothetical protein n=1 Tax=Amycolatopsis sp. DG1A-15b TaxID=3052846 RepID=UPI00255BAA85|nr:hypothetical protein [Amycolatopsis sp. DG1A-15b]WIX85702.1 hypothetical protein QRY02_31380 [Amycolatopsis sp. DG1A-15b]
MDLAALLEAMPNAEPLEGVPDAWRWTRTPTAPQFGSAAVLSTDREHMFQCYAHDSFDVGLARAVLRFVREHESELLAPPETLLRVAEGFAPDGYRFDIVGSVSPKVHRYHLPDNPGLHEVTRSVFPAYRCEFSGTENEDELAYRYSRAPGAQPTRWAREPNPFLRLRYRPANGKEAPVRGFSGPKSVVRELTELPSRENGYVEFENWQNRVWTATWQDTYVLAEGESEVGRMNLDEITEFVKDVLLGPNRVAGEHSFTKA